MKKISLCLFWGIFLAFLNACEKVVDIDIADGEPLPYIDAWITDKPGIQRIKFLKAVSYLGQQEPAPIADAQISLTDLTLNQTYSFVYADGAYSYDAGAENIGKPGHQYKLHIAYNGEQFDALDSLTRPTVIDSINYAFRPQKGAEKEGYYAEFFATDPAGATDYAWIRTYLNGSRNPYIPEMASIDGGFNEGMSDGFMFIAPFREAITWYDRPYRLGDEVKVLIRSLSKNTYGFLDQAINQLYSGGLFAKILNNAPSNVFPADPTSRTKIYGWFGMTAESELSVTIQ